MNGLKKSPFKRKAQLTFIELRRRIDELTGLLDKAILYQASRQRRSDGNGRRKNKSTKD